MDYKGIGISRETLEAIEYYAGLGNSCITDLQLQTEHGPNSIDRKLYVTRESVTLLNEVQYEELLAMFAVERIRGVCRGGFSNEEIMEWDAETLLHHGLVRSCWDNR